MKRADKLTEEYLRKTYPNYHFVKTLPRWMQKYRWKPTFLLRTKDRRNTLAVDIILSGIIPKYQYSKIVHNLLKEHDNLSVIIVTFEESCVSNPEIEELCKTYGIGLKIIIPGIGIQTIIRTDLDPVSERKELPLEDGWFPSAILENAKGLSQIDFHEVIDEFVEKVQLLSNNEKKTLTLVYETTDELIRYHPSFKNNFGQFMKLAHFEKILRLTNPESSEHIFHSFRVFLAGCPVINTFYDEFGRAHKPFCKMAEKKLRIEYAWLLTAIFHDIGRAKEGAVQFISNELDDEDLEISINVSEKRWARQHNITAKRVLGSLGAFIVNENENEEWDGGIIDDKDSQNITAEWINIYDGMKSHAVISAFDFLGDLFEKAAAANARTHRPFIVTHAATSALSILLHDWKIWPRMRKMKLIPVNCSMLPMAALLIYIDTWDNYKRRGKEPLTFIKEYIVNSRGAKVKVEWGDLSLMEKDEIGYIEYKKAMKNLLFALDIKYGMAGTV